MDPVLSALFPTVLELLHKASQTEKGQEILTKTKLAIEVALPKVQTVSEIAIKFLALDITGTATNKNNTLRLSKNLPIVENGLNLPLSYQRNQSLKFTNKISSDIDVVKGQNEILFLSNSINYFIESHKNRTGIDRGISYALQYDIQAVCNHLKKNPDIRFPGYLLHQLIGLNQTIEELNIFYNAILHDGRVYSHEDTVHYREIYDETFGIENKKQQGEYIPHTLLLEWNRDLALKNVGHKATGLFESVKGLVTKEQQQQLNDDAHDALYLLKAELESNESLEKKIKRKIQVMESNVIQISMD